MQMRMKAGCNPIYMHMQMLMKCECSDLGVLVHVYVHAEAKRLFNRINEFSLAGYPASTLFVCRRTTSAGEQTEGPAPRQPLIPKGHGDQPE